MENNQISWISVFGVFYFMSVWIPTHPNFLSRCPAMINIGFVFYMLGPIRIRYEHKILSEMLEGKRPRVRNNLRWNIKLIKFS
jgi:hypothetical protein